jgi:hypothetical protein
MHRMNAFRRDSTKSKNSGSFAYLLKNGVLTLSFLSSRYSNCRFLPYKMATRRSVLPCRAQRTWKAPGVVSNAYNRRDFPGAP